MTKCCNTHVGSTGRGGGGVSLQTKSGFGSATIFLSMSQNSAKWGGGNLAASIYGNDKVVLTISNCLFNRGYAERNGGGMYFEVFNEQSAITIQYTNLVENVNNHTSELYYESVKSAQGMLSVINSTIVHTETHSDYGVTINGCCPIITLTNTRIRLTKQNKFGLYVTSDQSHSNVMQINDCLFERSQSV